MLVRKGSLMSTNRKLATMMQRRGDRRREGPDRNPAAAAKAAGSSRQQASTEDGVHNVLRTLYPDIEGLEVIRAERRSDKNLAKGVQGAPLPPAVHRRVSRLVSACLRTNLQDEIILLWAKELPPEVCGVCGARCARKFCRHGRCLACLRMPPVNGRLGILIVEEGKWLCHTRGELFRQKHKYRTTLRSVTAEAKGLAERSLAHTNSHGAALVSALSYNQVRDCHDDLENQVNRPLTTIKPEVLLVDQKYVAWMGPRPEGEP